QIADPDVQASLATLPPAAPDPHASTTPARTLSVDPHTRMGSPAARPSNTALRYRIIRTHARGGLGQVFVAHDQELGREVALKEIQAKHADDPKSRARFMLEAEITGGLEHPGNVPVYGLGAHPDGRPYYPKRFVKGHSLQEASE